jgi:hypothetical protein
MVHVQVKDEPTLLCLQWPKKVHNVASKISKVSKSKAISRGDVKCVRY